MKEIKNAKIINTTIGIEGHGILTCWLHLEFDGAGQGFGGWDIRTNAGQWIEKILSTIEVDNWEDLKGETIRVEADHGKIYKIGNIIKDKWFNPEKDLKVIEAVKEKME